MLGNRLSHLLCQISVISMKVKKRHNRTVKVLHIFSLNFFAALSGCFFAFGKTLREKVLSLILTPIGKSPPHNLRGFHSIEFFRIKWTRPLNEFVVLLMLGIS